MPDVRIVGDKNVTNTGIVCGDCIVNNIILDLKFCIVNPYSFFPMNNEDKEKSLVNMTEAQKMAEAIEKFAQAELTRAEADKNNSIANLNYSKIMLEDRELIKQLKSEIVTLVSKINFHKNMK